MYRNPIYDRDRLTIVLDISTLPLPLYFGMLPLAHMVPLSRLIALLCCALTHICLSVYLSILLDGHLSPFSSRSISSLSLVLFCFSSHRIGTIYPILRGKRYHFRCNNTHHSLIEWGR